MAADNGHPMLRPLAAPPSSKKINRPKQQPRAVPQIRDSRNCPAEVTARQPKGVFYRTFSVASPIIARISEMIQKRITMVGSAQPFFS